MHPIEIEQDFEWFKDIKEKEEITKPFFLEPIKIDKEADKKRKYQKNGPNKTSTKTNSPIIEENINKKIKHLSSENKALKKCFCRPDDISILRRPILLSDYLSLIFNAIIIIVFSYAIILFTFSLTQDIRLRFKEERYVLEKEVREAKRLYKINKCDPKCRVPAMENKCTKWGNVIKKGSSDIFRTKIMLNLCCELLNEIVYKISIKGYFLLILIFILFMHCRKK